MLNYCIHDTTCMLIYLFELDKQLDCMEYKQEGLRYTEGRPWLSQNIPTTCTPKTCKTYLFYGLTDCVGSWTEMNHFSDMNVWLMTSVAYFNHSLRVKIFST